MVVSSGLSHQIVLGRFVRQGSRGADRGCMGQRRRGSGLPGVPEFVAWFRRSRFAWVACGSREFDHREIASGIVIALCVQSDVSIAKTPSAPFGRSLAIHGGDKKCQLLMASASDVGSDPADSILVRCSRIFGTHRYWRWKSRQRAAELALRIPQAGTLSRKAGEGARDHS